MARRLNRNRRLGATLIECVAAIVVLGIAVPPLVSLFREVAAQEVDRLQRTVGLMYAEGLLEELASKAFEDPDEPAGSFGTEEALRASYDDVDDFDGLTNAPPRRLDGTLLDDYGGFRRSVDVENVASADPAGSAVADGSTELKRITVTVDWPGGQIVLTTLRALASGSEEPLDVAASVATLVRRSGKRFEIDLVSSASTDLVLDSFALDSDAGGEELRRLRLDDREIWRGNAFVPTGPTLLNRGSTADRTVPAGGSPTFRVEFRRNQSGTVEYTLVLDFTDGSSSTLTFTVNW